MKKKVKKPIWIVLLVFICTAGIAVGVWAYFSNINTVDNRLITKGSEVFLKEYFNPQDEWVPGETKEKEVSFGNRGEAAQVLRFKITEQWYDNNETPNNLADDTAWTYAGTYSPLPATINWTGGGTGPAAASWYHPAGSEWYYYTKVLPGGTSAAPSMTPQVIDSVKFSDEISNGGPGAADDFSNKRYSLKIEMESLSVSNIMTEDSWHMRFTQTGNDLSWIVVP